MKTHLAGNYTLKFSKLALKDAKKLESAKLRTKAKLLLEILKINPFQNPPPYEKLIGDLDGLHSRRINVQHRLVYEVLENVKIVKVLRMWSHYE